MKSNGLLKGVSILVVCNLIGKVLGAIYRIPLARLLGPIGMGMYQLVFPLYCLILTISTTGVPVAISKLVAEYNSKNEFKNSKKVLHISLIILTVISLIGAVFTVLCSKVIANIQGNVDIYVCYFAIAPAILFVGVISAFRGYFQGNLKMFPTAISSLIEQVAKMIFGLFLAGRFLDYGVEFAVFGALLGVSISEIFALLFLFICYIFFRKKAKLKSQNLSFKFLSKQILNQAIPVTFGGLIAPVTTMIDSLLIVNLMMFSGFSNEVATSFLGLQSGVVEPLLNIPVIIAVSISTVILPNISKFFAERSNERINNCINNAFQISLCVSVACFVCFVIFGRQVLNFLYGSILTGEELLLSIKLLFFGSVNIVFLSLVQISSGILQGLGQSKVPVKSLLIGCSLKIILDVLLIPIPSINIFGSIISSAVCYISVFALNYFKIRQLTNIKIKNSLFFISIQACFVCSFAYVTNLIFNMLFNEFISLLVAGFIAVSVFFVTYYIFFIYDGNIMFKEKQVKWKKYWKLCFILIKYAYEKHKN